MVKRVRMIPPIPVNLDEEAIDGIKGKTKKTATRTGGGKPKTQIGESNPSIGESGSSGGESANEETKAEVDLF